MRTADFHHEGPPFPGNSTSQPYPPYTKLRLYNFNRPERKQRNFQIFQSKDFFGIKVLKLLAARARAAAAATTTPATLNAVTHSVAFQTGKAADDDDDDDDDAKRGGKNGQIKKEAFSVCESREGLGRFRFRLLVDTRTQPEPPLLASLLACFVALLC